MLGSALSGMHYRFNNPDENRWWNENNNRYPNSVYYKQYPEPVNQDRFVYDCVNITVTNYKLEPSQNPNMTEMETKVMHQVIEQRCTQQYREYRLASRVKQLFSDPSLILGTMLVIFLAMH